MDTFLVYNINPALVISLYPIETISGKLHVPRDQWMSLFGAVEDARLEPEVAVATDGGESLSKGLLRSMAQLSVTKRASLDTVRTGKEEDAASVSEKAAPIMTGDLRERFSRLS